MKVMAWALCVVILMGIAGCATGGGSGGHEGGSSGSRSGHCH